MSTEILDKIREGAIPEHALSAIVRGLMPLEGGDMLTAMYLICSRAPNLLEEAQPTFAELPLGMKKAFFENRAIETGMIDFFLFNFNLPVEAKSAAILNPRTSGKAIAAIAPTLQTHLVDLAVNNQVKILEEPGIVDALLQNPGLTINQKQKLDEYDRLLFKNKISPAEELEALSVEEIQEAAIAETKEFVAVFGKENVPPKTERPGAASESGETQDNERNTIQEQISNMSVPQKIQAAIKGDREVRNILVRDANKLVSTSVIKSPRITEAEVEFYAALRNVQTDVLRLIAMNREWMKSYKVVHTLVKNPRTPLAHSMRMLPRLHKRDIKNLTSDKGIPEALRTLARKMGRQMD